MSHSSRALKGSLVVLACLAAACSSSGSGKSGGTGATGGSGNGAGQPGSGTTSEGSQAATEKGVITDFNTKKPVAGATVTAGDQKVTTAADGSYSFTVQKGQSFRLTVEADGYAKLIEQESSLDADYDKGKTTIVPQGMAAILTGMLAGYDASLGVVSVQVIATGGCASEDGATVKVSPEGSAKVSYFANSLPSTSLTAVKGGEFPSAVLYNVQPDTALTITVEHGSCKESPFPVVQGSVSYSGAMSTESGETTGFARVFLQ